MSRKIDENWEAAASNWYLRAARIPVLPPILGSQTDSPVLGERHGIVLEHVLKRRLIPAETKQGLLELRTGWSSSLVDLVHRLRKGQRTRRRSGKT